MKKLIIVLLFLTFLTTNVLAVQTIAVTAPNATGVYIGPTSKTYSITWTWQDTLYVAATHDTNVNIRIFNDSTGAWQENLIADANMDTYCGGQVDYATSKSCTYSWTTNPSTADGNYVIDINGQTFRNATDVNTSSDASDGNFQLDTTNPSVVTSFVVNNKHDGLFDLFWDLPSSTGAADFNSYWIWVSESQFSTCSVAGGAYLTENITNSATNTTSYGTADLNVDKVLYFCVVIDDVAGNEDDTGMRIVAQSSTEIGEGSAVTVPPGEEVVDGVIVKEADQGNFEILGLSLPIGLWLLFGGLLVLGYFAWTSKP